ncbi:MAG: hypothetical protein OEX07_12010, partial [Gammaproteobacteria bacterium]|nr:hypothetical protein [Gammaproteobacteria bacterium]
DKSLKPLILSEKGFALTDAIALFPRNKVATVQRKNSEPGVFNGVEPEGIINVKSVYDTDQFGRMGPGVLTPFEIGRTPIPQTEPADPSIEPREYVADIAALKNPALMRADQRPARFLRVTASIPVPKELDRAVIGETDFDMQRLIGYAPIEPDGSVKVKVPADIPITLTVLDSNGRAFEKHSNRVQVRPGETLTCNGCHSPQRSFPLNRFPVAGSHPNTALKYSNGQISGAFAFENETMAETRTRTDVTALELSKDVIYRDVWTDTNVTPMNNEFSYLYASLMTPAPTNGEINYPDHIQPLWDLPRPEGACSSCHDGVTNDATNPTKLSLNGFLGSGLRMLSYNHLLVGRLVLDDSGLPMYETVDGSPKLRRALPLINPGFARGSYFVEKMFGTELFAEKILPVDGLDHSNFLSDAEKRLVVEWIDIGAQYFNTPKDESGNLRVLESSLAFFKFGNSIWGPMVAACGECHARNTIDLPVNDFFVDTSFVLTRDVNDDFIAASYMVSGTANPQQSDLLTRPTGKRDQAHWASGKTGVPILSETDPLYKLISDWIQGL